ncbi:MAG: hypothetical protein EYC70_01125 [Planctomycetota bacterium]|nr:MAG: hypothetical protein EYC70_01125 [Planctomycetota bacterium]
MEPQSLQVEWVAIERLALNPANPRINDPAVPHVAASLRRFGWQQPVVAKRSGEVIAGNTRLKAARSQHMATHASAVWSMRSRLGCQSGRELFGLKSTIREPRRVQVPLGGPIATTCERCAV